MKAMTEQDSQEIRLCALVLSVVAFFLFIAAEIVHDNAYACRAVILLVATGALGFAWIGPLTLLAGTLRSKKFQWWQPFQGGVEFVWMQAFGWCLHTFVLTASVVVLANSQLPKWFEGQYLFLGVTGFIAQILLNLSIGCFREVDTEQPAFQLPLNAKTVVSLLVSGSGLLLFVFYDLFSHLGQSPVVIAVGCVEFIASALVIHVFYGCADIPGYRIWQPFEGERTFLLLQYFGWQLFAFTIGGAMNLFCSANDMSGYGSSKGTATAIGTMGMTSQILLLVSLQYFDKGSASQTSKASPSDHAAQPTGLLPLNHITSKTKTKLPAEIYVTSMLCSGALAVGLLSYTSRAKIGVAPEQIEQFFLAHEKVGWIISLCSLAIAAPISNMGGVRSKPQYSWWQPFQGGTKFVFLQTLGWLWYGFYLALSIVLCMNSPKFGELIGCFVLLVGAGSAGAIALSLSYFEPQDLKTTKARDSNQVLYWCDATKGEVAMVVLLSMSSMLFHLLVDFFQDRMLPSIKALCVVLAMTLFMLASTISHCSGQKLHSRFRIWQPFEGGSRYVIHQAVGWSLCAIQLLFDSLLLSLVSQALPKGLSSLLGFFGLMPQILILVSNQHFEPAPQDQDDLKPSRPSLRIVRTAAHPQTWSSLLKTPALKWHAGSNLFVAIVSICLFVSAEILGVKGMFHRAEEVLYIFGCLLSVYGILSAHCVLGPKLHSSYRVIQPFRGGIKFITFQGAAWTIVSVTWAVSITVIYWSSVFFRFRGIQLLTGLLYFVSQMLLLYSLPFFEVTKSHVKAIVRGKPRLQNEIRRKAEDLVNQYFVGRLLGFSACCVFVLVDFTMLHVGPSIPMFPATICAVLGLFSSIPLTYKFATSTYGPKAKSISGSIVFIVLGCALWSFTLLLGALFSYQLWSTQAIDRSMPRSENAPTQFMGTFTGSVGFMAQLLFFQASESSLLKQGPKGEVSSEENLVMVMTKLKKNLKCASIWVYSAITLVSGLVYAHTKSVIPKHLATTQVLGLVFCCVVVIWSAWCIQQQIISSGGGIVQYSKCFAVSQDCESDIVTKQIPILDVGLDCYAQLVAFLTVSEIVGMSTTCKTAHAFHTDALWRQIFARRYGGSHMDRTLLKLKTADTRGYEDTNENAITVRTKPFAATSLHRMETTVLNMVCGLEFPTIQPAPPKSAIISMQSKWKTFCIGREKHFRFDQCKVCKTVEAFSSAPQLWEMQENCARRSPSTWVNLCHCVNPVTLRHEKAHRGCLEILRKQYHATEPHPRPQRMEIEYCASCELGITEVGRLPNTIRELLQVTWEHFCAPEHEFGGGFFSFVPCSASIFIFALKSVGWGSCSMYIWLVTVVALCFVVNSPRFDRALAQIGGEESPSYQAYQRTYYALVLSSIAHLAWCCPTVNQSDAMRNPSLTQTLILLGFRVNFGIFLILALTCFFVFWRTQYRISTVRGVDEASLSESANAQSIAPSADKSCVLCLLKLCSEDRG